MAVEESLPLDMVWRDGALHPVSIFWARKANEVFADGQVVSVVAREDRSSRSHRHYFACIKSAWENLPPLLAEQFRNPEMLRKFALIKAGYCRSQQMVCASPRDAQRTADFIRPVDAYSLVTRKGRVVTIFTAKSQRKEYQDNKEFQQAKRAVLEVLAAMIGVQTNELTEEGHRLTMPQPDPAAIPAPDREAA